MLGYATWRELTEAFVRVTARALGWEVTERQQAKTGSVYLVLRRRDAIEARAVRVRLSDHRSHRLKAHEFSVRQAATAKLRLLPVFLMRWRDESPPGS
jgi:hypothetical protein